MSAKKQNKTKPTTHNRAATASTTLSTDNRALDARPLHERPTTSPNKFMAIFFGIPTAILIAAIAVKVLQAG